MGGGGRYFPELKIWKGEKIMALIDSSPHDYYCLFNKNVPTTGMPLKAANMLTGKSFAVMFSQMMKYQLYDDKKACFEIYEAN
jgi:hypothetical protein